MYNFLFKAYRKDRELIECIFAQWNELSWKVLQYFAGLCLLSTHPGWCESSLECWCSQVQSRSSCPRAQSSPEYFCGQTIYFLWDYIFSMRTCVIASRLKTLGPTFSVWILNSDIHFGNHKSSWHPPYTVLRSCIHHFTLVLPDKKPADIRRIPEIRHRIQLNFKTLNSAIVFLEKRKKLQWVSPV